MIFFQKSKQYRSRKIDFLQKRFGGFPSVPLENVAIVQFLEVSLAYIYFQMLEHFYKDKFRISRALYYLQIRNILPATLKMHPTTC